MELYFGMMGIYFEPRYSLARIIGTKISMIMTLVDDTYDAYGTLPEVISFTDALQRYTLFYYLFFSCWIVNLNLVSSLIDLIA